MIRKLSLVFLVASLALGAASGCGGTSSNNDQGTSFLAYGWFKDSEGTEGSSGSIAPLASDITGLSGSLPTGVVVGADGLAVIVSIGLQNRLSSQFIRVVRIDCSYEVSGASALLDIPNDSWNTSSVIASDPSADPVPTVDEDPLAGGPPAGQGSTGIIEFEIVSTDIMSYLNVNRNLLPELPFRMTAICHAVGVTQGGDTIVSNDLFYQIQFVDVAECCTSDSVVPDDPGFPTGPGSGGGIDFDDGESSVADEDAAA